MSTRQLTKFYKNGKQAAAFHGWYDGYPQFYGKLMKNFFHSRKLPKTPRDLKKLMQSYGKQISKHTNLEQVNEPVEMAFGFEYTVHFQDTGVLVTVTSHCWPGKPKLVYKGDLASMPTDLMDYYHNEIPLKPTP